MAEDNKTETSWFKSILQWIFLAVFFLLAVVAAVMEAIGWAILLSPVLFFRWLFSDELKEMGK